MAKIWDIWKEDKVDAPAGRPKFKKGDKLIFPVAVDKTPKEIMRLTTDKISSEWYYMIKFKGSKEIHMTESWLLNSKARKVKAMDKRKVAEELIKLAKEFAKFAKPGDVVLTFRNAKTMQDSMEFLDDHIKAVYQSCYSALEALSKIQLGKKRFKHLKHDSEYQNDLHFV